MDQMYTCLVLLTLLMSIGIGWSIGANDAANSLGTAVGARVLTLRQAILMIAVFGMLGAVTQGQHVVKTIGKGIVPMHLLPDSHRCCLALVACFGACVWTALATYWKMPVSTSHSIVGAVAGGGLALSAPVRWGVLKDIFICWLLTPLGAAVLGAACYVLLAKLFYKRIPPALSDRLVRWLVIASGCYVAYTWGANDVANATGVVAGAGLFSPTRSVALGGLAIVLGIMTWGYRVIETIGSSITQLVPLMAFAAQLASGINVHVYTLFGIPVSTSHSIVGAVFGVGLVKGVRVVNLRIMREIVVCWVATPAVSGLISYAVLRLLLSFMSLNTGIERSG